MNFYIIQFGGTRTGTLFEAHEVRTAFGETFAAAIGSIRDRVRDALRAAHTDGYAEVALIAPDDAAPPPPDQLFLVETGANGPAMFEQHGYEFVWAANAREAQQRTVMPVHHCHVDTVFNVSRAARERGWRVPRTGADGGPYIPAQLPHYQRL